MYPGNDLFLLHGCALWFRFSLSVTSFNSLFVWLAGIRSCCYFFFSSLQLLHKKEMEILMTETQNLGGILPCSNLKVPPAVVCVTGVLPSFHFAGSLPTGGNRALPYFLCVSIPVL